MVLSKREFIKDIILEQQHNNKIAIEDEKEHITYRELHNTCTKISETIQRESDCKNNRNVGIFLNNSVELCKSLFFDCIYGSNNYSSGGDAVKRTDS